LKLCEAGAEWGGSKSLHPSNPYHPLPVQSPHRSGERQLRADLMGLPGFEGRRGDERLSPEEDRCVRLGAVAALEQLKSGCFWRLPPHEAAGVPAGRGGRERRAGCLNNRPASPRSPTTRSPAAGRCARRWARCPRPPPAPAPRGCAAATPAPASPPPRPDPRWRNDRRFGCPSPAVIPRSPGRARHGGGRRPGPSRGRRPPAPRPTAGRARGTGTCR